MCTHREYIQSARLSFQSSELGPPPLGSVAPLPFWVQGGNTLSCREWRDQIPTKEHLLYAYYNLSTVRVYLTRKSLLLLNTKFPLSGKSNVTVKKKFYGGRKESHDFFCCLISLTSAYTDVMALSPFLSLRLSSLCHLAGGGGGDQLKSKIFFFRWRRLMNYYFGKHLL